MAAIRLRLGVLANGRLQNERWFSPDRLLTIGRGGDVDVAMDPWTLFAPERGRFRLALGAGMRARLAPGRDLTEGARELLDVGDRGRVEIGDLRLLFEVQEVAAREVHDFRPRLLPDEERPLAGAFALFGALGVVFAARIALTTVPVVTLDTVDDHWTQIAQRAYVPAPMPIEVTAPPVAEIPRHVRAPAPTVARPSGPRPHETQEAMKRRLAQDDLLIGFVVTRAPGQGMAEDHLGDAQLRQMLGHPDRVVTDGTPSTRTGAIDTTDGTISVGRISGGNAALTDTPVPVSVTAPTPPSCKGPGPDPDQAQISKVVNAHLGEMQYCYDAELKNHPELAGRVEMEFVIAHGQVTGVEASANVTGDTALASCMSEKIRRWHFAPSVSGDVVWPFVFSAR